MTFKEETHPRYVGGLRKVKKSFFQPEMCVGSGRRGRSPPVGRQGGMAKGSTQQYSCSEARISGSEATQPGKPRSCPVGHREAWNYPTKEMGT